MTQNTSQYYYGKGKRKTAIAKVRLYQNGTGAITVNSKEVHAYLTVPGQVGSITEPFRLTNTTGKFDVSVLVIGGGVMAQGDAIRHGIARALLLVNPEYRAALKKAGFLTRDSRIKERKKPGLRGARRAPQFSKR